MSTGSGYLPSQNMIWNTKQSPPPPPTNNFSKQNWNNIKCEENIKWNFLFLTPPPPQTPQLRGNYNEKTPQLRAHYNERTSIKGRTPQLVMVLILNKRCSFSQIFSSLYLLHNKSWDDIWEIAYITNIGPLYHMANYPLDEFEILAWSENVTIHWQHDTSYVDIDRMEAMDLRHRR